MKVKRPELFFTAIIFLFGTILLLITPAGANYDEETYMARIWEMGLGHIMPNSYLDEGANLPNGFLTLSYRRQVNLPVIDLDTWQKQFETKIDWQDFEKHQTRAVYFPTLFMVQAIIMRFFGTFLNLPILVLYYILRFSYLLIYCLLVYFSIKVLPFGKWVFGTLAIAPMCLIQATSVSSDPVIIGISFLFIAWILRLCAEPTKGMSKKDLLITCLLILAIGTLKPNTIFLLVLLLVIPKSKTADRKVKIAILVSAAMSVALSFGWSYIASQYFVSRENSDGNTITQLLSLFTNPLDFLKSLWVTLSRYTLTFIKQAIGVSGYGNWLMPSMVYWVFPIVVLLAFFAERSEINLSKRQRIFFGLAGLFNFLMVFVIFYVVETTPGYGSIWGVQGRYFIPFIPLLLIPILFKGRFQVNHVINGILVILISIICVGSLFLNFHLTCGSSWYSRQVCSYPRYRNWDPNTFLGIRMDKETRIRQNFVVQCKYLSQVEIWVNKNEAVEGQEELFVLETMDWEPIQTNVIRSEDIPENGWMTIDLDPPLEMKNEELQFEILPSNEGGIPLLELGYFPTNEYSRGVIWINDEGQGSDLVFKYNCLDGISTILK